MPRKDARTPETGYVHDRPGWARRTLTPRRTLPCSLCGGVEYDLSEPEGMGVCHCTRCRRWTGSSLTGVLVSPSSFEVTKGQDLVKRYESEFAPRHFCSSCGSSLYDDLGGKYYVAAGLMGDLDLEPQFHLQVAFKAPWEVIGDDAPQYDEAAPS